MNKIRRSALAIELIMTLITAIALGSCCNTQKSENGSQMTAMTRGAADTIFNDKERLGKLLFFDTSLSTPPGQSCASCHDPGVAFADPVKELPVSRGARPGVYGNRNDLAASYAAFVPPLHRDPEENIWVGGLFWDGRVNTLAEQAMQPPLNPLEMANPDVCAIAEKLRALEYAPLFKEVYGSDALADPDSAFAYMADAIEAYEKTSELNPFTSKYDHWLRGEADLSEQEKRGLELFEAEEKGNCAACHPSRPAENGTPPLFTDFTYDNLGVPKNPENPFYTLPPDLNPDGYDFVDLGLGAIVKDSLENGKFRVPTLRNAAVTDPYMHNGIFKNLFQMLAFYNNRDVAPWPGPEVPQNVNRDELGDLGLTNQELEDIVVFLRTLTDGWNPENENNAQDSE